MNNNKKTKKSKLDKLLESLLKEDTIPETPKNPQEFAPVQTPQDVSLDQIVDRYLIRYEKESIPTVDNYEGELVDEAVSHSSILEFVLKEADDTEDPPADDEDATGGELDLGGGADTPDAGGDTGGLPDTGGGDDSGLDLGAGAEATGGDENAPAEPEKAVMNTPQINLNNFARSVARLVNNYEVLVNPKNTILNRVRAYVTSNYDDRTAAELMDMLDKNFSLRTTEQQDKNDQELDMKTPMTAGALGDPG